MRLLKHAIPVVAHFDWALALTLSAPRDRLAHLVAPGLFLDTFEGQGFLAVACVQTRRLRPAGVPPFAGLDFFLAGYRLFVTRDRGGRVRRGLQILGSETDRGLMAAAGRLFTHYGYRRTAVEVSGDGGRRRIATSSGLVLEADCGRAELPPGSVFRNWESARRYAGPMPFTFASEGDAIVSVEGTRAHWKPQPVALVDARVPFLDKLVGAPVRPAAAFLVEHVDYRWGRGVREPVGW
jgi:hypothetical protein